RTAPPACATESLRDSRACARDSPPRRRRALSAATRRPPLPRPRSCVPRSPEYLPYPLDPGDQRLDVALVAVEAEARPRGRLDAERGHQRLGAMMPGADRDAAFVQYGADVVGMNPFDGEADDAGAVLRPEQGERIDVVQRRARCAHQRRLVRRDRVQPDRFDIV